MVRLRHERARPWVNLCGFERSSSRKVEAASGHLKALRLAWVKGPDADCFMRAMRSRAVTASQEVSQELSMVESKFAF
jgi:hypothetical protein